MPSKVVSPAQQGSNVQNEKILRRFLLAQDSLVYQTADLSLGSLSGMMSPREGGEAAINLDPDFQRRERWSPDKQSGLIESFLLNVPVPPIYLAEDEYGKYSVVDGKQRLTAIRAFMAENLELRDLEKFVELEGRTFATLPEALQNSLNIRPYVRVVTLLKQSDPTLKFEVFTRLNRGGEPMLPQELRKVAYRGALSDLVFDLSDSQFLREQLKIISSNSPAYKNMEDAEYVLRYFALRSSWQSFSGSLRGELDGYMIKNQHSKPAQIKSLRRDFLRSLNGCQSIWGEHAFKRHTGTGWRSQFLAGMYDAEMLAIGELNDSQLEKSIRKSATAVKRTAALFTDPVFEKSVRQGTNTPSFVRTRIKAVTELLKAL
ncbi:DUF262 domain-containing protein [Ideonella sp. 4Y16]|uniref:DUF262 domain-containing protein n=1 Tax=Ideonella alba TaxID=2824118 RepID=A0A940YF40_9BURK|nr:DUF262 domain-containing protein [Ideonella alba]MBQ0932081.1 DUF262 domain-containing protein [Ideonella alba]MBQ0945637.1 DUF262 domain-containing protein [Ideonella alba]